MRSAAGETVRAVVSIFLVLVGAAAVLASFDALPRWLQGEPRGVRRVVSVEEAERYLHARVFLPSFFPDTYRWPPSSVHVTRDDGGAVVLAFEARDGTPALLLAETVSGMAEVPARLLPESAVIQKQRAALSGDGTLSRIVSEDGTLWNQLEWTLAGRRFLMQGKGSSEVLVRMARSIHGGAR